MESVILTRLEEVMETLKELKSEYSVMRKEILGTGLSGNTRGLLGNITLRQILEETQFRVKQINDKILDNERQKENTEETKTEREFNPNDECPEEYPVVEIQRKTIREERKWMEEKINEMKKTVKIKDGESLRGKTVEEISDSIPRRLFTKNIPTCALKLSNFLDSALSDPQFYFESGSTNSGPSRVDAQKHEVFSFQGDSLSCSFLCSFAIDRHLRLAISCCNSLRGHISFGIGFTPADVPTDETLWERLNDMPEAPDVFIDVGRFLSINPLELFISHGNFLVRSHMTAGQRSIVHVEILEMNPEIQSKPSGNEIKRHIFDGKTVKSDATFQNSGISRISETYGKFSCNIQIANCLNVTLTNLDEFYCKCNKNDFLPSEILPFRRETFFAGDDENVEAMFVYEIESTEFAIAVALKVKPDENSFAAEFLHRNESATGEDELKALMDSNGWKIHDYRKYANAREGTVFIRMGNIRAELQMTEEKQALLKIRIFAI